MTATDVLTLQVPVYGEGGYGGTPNAEAGKMLYQHKKLGRTARTDININIYIYIYIYTYIYINTVYIILKR
jgi:hypothetical protein